MEANPSVEVYTLGAQYGMAMKLIGVWESGIARVARLHRYN